MRITIDVSFTNPGHPPTSYPGTNWGKYGWCAWCYDGYLGITEWVNFQQFCTEPKYSNPTALLMYPNYGVLFTWNKVLQTAGGTYLPGVVFHNQIVNPATGEGIEELLQTQVANPPP